MNISLKSMGAILLLGLTLAGTGLAAPPRGTMEQLILSRLYRAKPDEQHQRALKQLQGEKAPRPPALPSEDKLLGQTLGAVVPLQDVSAVETAEDEFSLPAPLVAAALMRSRFVKYESLPPLHLGASRPITLTWPDQRALRIDLFP